MRPKAESRHLPKGKCAYYSLRKLLVYSTRYIHTKLVQGYEVSICKVKIAWFKYSSHDIQLFFTFQRMFRPIKGREFSNAGQRFFAFEMTCSTLCILLLIIDIKNNAFYTYVVSARLYTLCWDHLIVKKCIQT